MGLFQLVRKTDVVLVLIETSYIIQAYRKYESRRGKMKQFLISALISSALILLICGVPATAYTNIISQGDVVFIGEEGLDVSHAIPEPYTEIAYFQAGTNPDRDVPAETIAVTRKDSFYISPVSFLGLTGTWYQYDSGSGRTGGVAFVVKEPTISVRLYTNPANSDCSNAAVSRDSYINFRIETNLYAVAERTSFTPNMDGFISLSIQAPDGSRYNAVKSADMAVIPLEYLPVDQNPWYLVPAGISDGWNVKYQDNSGGYLYESGTYLIWPEIRLNHIDRNYQGFLGTSEENPVRLTIGTDSLSITVNDESVLKSGSFVTTIAGSPNTEYYLWVAETGMMSGRPDDQPPQIFPYQERIYQDDEYGPYSVGMHMIPSPSGKTIREDVPDMPYHGVHYYARVVTDDAGLVTVGWRTTDDTKEKRYTIRVIGGTVPIIRSDEVPVTIIKGDVTVETGSSGTYFLGDEIRLYGINSESCDTYLFLSGPNLPSNGGKLTDPTKRVVDGDPSTFTRASGDNCETWEYTWYTGNLGIDAGSYSIYAVNRPVGRNNLKGTLYKTISVTFREPYLSVTPAISVVAQGDTYHIRGTGLGSPNAGIAIWIFGKNFVFYDTEQGERDGSFDYTLDSGVTSYLFPGEYQVILQHPMYNGQFDLYPDNTRSEVQSVYPYPGAVLFRIAGPGALEADSAAYALTSALNSPFIDDTYNTRQFIITSPKIKINPIKEHSPGEIIVISGVTNMGTDTNLLVEVTENWFSPTSKEESREFSGISGIVPVIAGYDTYNQFSFPADTSGMHPGEYMVRISGISIDVTDSTMMTLQYPVPTPVPTATKTVNVTRITTPLQPPMTDTIPIATPVLTPILTPEPIPVYPDHQNIERLAFVIIIILLVVILFIVQMQKKEQIKEEEKDVKDDDISVSEDEEK